MHGGHAIRNVGVYLLCTVKPNSEISAVSTVLDIQRMLSFTFVWIGIYESPSKTCLGFGTQRAYVYRLFVYRERRSAFSGMSRFFLRRTSSSNGKSLTWFDTMWNDYFHSRSRGIRHFKRVSRLFVSRTYCRENVAFHRVHDNRYRLNVCMCVCLSVCVCM